jgi:hypothetical protein
MPSIGRASPAAEGNVGRRNGGDMATRLWFLTLSLLHRAIQASTLSLVLSGCATGPNPYEIARQDPDYRACEYEASKYVRGENFGPPGDLYGGVRWRQATDDFIRQCMAQKGK